MSFFDDVKDFFSDTFGVGEAEKAQSGMADSASKAANGANAKAQKAAQMGDEATFVAQDIEVVRANQDLQMSKQSLDRARTLRDQKQQELRTNLARAQQELNNASLKQDYTKKATGNESDPYHAKIQKCKDALDNFPNSQWAQDFDSAADNYHRMKERLADAKATAKVRYRQAIGR